MVSPQRLVGRRPPPRASGGAAAAASLALAMIVGACSRRPHVGGHKPDAGPSVVLLDRRVPKAPRAAGVDPGFIDEKEPNDDAGRAQPIQFPKGVRGVLGGPGGGAPDVDVYQWLVGGEGRQAARIELSTAEPEGAPAPAGVADTGTTGNAANAKAPEAAMALELLDGDGKPPWLATGEAGADGTLVISNAIVEVGKTYFVVVRPRAHGSKSTSRLPQAGAAPATAIPYQLLARTRPLPDGEEAEPNDNPAHANALAAGVEETGYLGRSHDEDWMKLPPELPDAGTMRIELVPPAGVATSLRLRDAAGALVVEAHAGKGKELRLRNPPSVPGGSLVIRADSGKNFDETWSLRLGAEPSIVGAEVEPNGSPSTANRIELSSGSSPEASVSGFLWPGDADVYRIHPTSTGFVRVDLAPPDGVDLKLERLAEGGAVAQKADTGGAGKPERLSLMPASDRDIIVRVSGHGGSETAFDGPYVLRVTVVNAADGGSE